LRLGDLDFLTACCDFNKDQPDLLLEILLNHEQIFEAVVSALSGIKPLKRQDPFAKILHFYRQPLVESPANASLHAPSLEQVCFLVQNWQHFANLR